MRALTLSHPQEMHREGGMAGSSATSELRETSKGKDLFGVNAVRQFFNRANPRVTFLLCPEK